MRSSYQTSDLSDWVRSSSRTKTERDHQFGPIFHPVFTVLVRRTSCKPPLVSARDPGYKAERAANGAVADVVISGRLLCVLSDLRTFLWFPFGAASQFVFWPVPQWSERMLVSVPICGALSWKSVTMGAFLRQLPAGVIFFSPAIFIFILLLSSAAADRSKLNVPRVLLPRATAVVTNFTLKVTNGDADQCCVWTSTRSDVGEFQSDIVTSANVDACS